MDARGTVRRLAAGMSVGAVLATLLAPTASGGLLVTANDDAYSVSHDHVLNVAAPGVLANDTGLAPTAAKLTNPSHGTVTVNANGAISYHPAGKYVGTDSFTYEARVLNLGILVTDPATVTLTVTNATPVANDDSYVATTGVSLNVGAPGVLANDTDADGDHLQAILVSSGGNGSLSLKADGGFTYKSGGSFVGTYTFTYRVSDGITTSAFATVTIDVRPKTSTPPPTPPPTPTPTPTPQPTPTPTPQPTPTPTPTARPTPTLPLPTLPLPSLPLPTLPVPSLLPIVPTPTPVPSGGPGPSPSPSDSTAPSSAPSSPATAAPSASPGVAAGGGATGGPSGGTGGGLTVGQAGAAPPPPIDGLTDVGVVGFGGLMTWAVPSLALTVPGLLLVLAIVAQMLGASVWLPVIRRWLGGFGFRRRRAARGTPG